ncbi:hypothetical protein FACS1894202_07590 [Clostridia bacterium]|nr:hypothetical protein FACS1894202_07590 [Clostridia bacterium]
MNGYKKITECQIFLTRKCNILCDYCKLTKKQFKNELTIEEWKNAFSVLDSLGIKTVKIMGGEPTVLNGLEELLTHIRDNTDITCALLSNSLISEERIDSLIEAGLQGYFASVDTIEKTSDETSASEKKSHAGFTILKKMKSKGLRLLGANVVITPQTLKVLPSLVQTLSDCGFWVNLCPIIYANNDHTDIEWEYRTKAEAEYCFTSADIPAINDTMIELLQMKNAGCKIAVPDSYLFNMSRYAIKCNWKCQDIVQLRIDADGALMLCNDIRGEISQKYNIRNLTAETFEHFERDWMLERTKTDCPGCYWSCFYLANENIKQNRLEFHYLED